MSEAAGAHRNGPLIALAAGEASGDQLGASLVQALRAHCPEARFEGIAGPAMQAQGCTAIYPMERLSVMGFSEVASRYLQLMWDRRKLGSRWLGPARPDLFIGIDAPDFNLGLEKRLRRGGIPVVHYVSPSVWAWRRYRVHGIRQSVDRMLTLFPFEADFYQQAQVEVTCVGHPMAEEIPLEPDQAAARRATGLAADGEVVALLPGSRMSEVRELGGLMLETAQALLATRPGLRFVMPAANARIHAELSALTTSRNLPVTVLHGQARAAMTAADVVVLASGTASLEAMLCKRPMVITYKVHPLTYRIMKALIHVPHVGLPNILAGEALVPERLQQEATAENLVADVLHWLQNPSAVRALQARFAELHQRLRLGGSERAAGAVLEVLGR